jgi:hypothetical protein
LDSQGYEVFGFSDDIVIMVRGRVDSVLSVRMQTGQSYAYNWYEEVNLRINPNKSVVISFTSRRRHSLKNSVIRGVTTEFFMETKYLGLEVVLTTMFFGIIKEKE